MLKGILNSRNVKENRKRRMDFENFNRKCKEKEENHFEKIPTDLKYKIFAGLDCEDLVSAKSTCREWCELLSQSALHSLFKSRRQLIESSHSFLVRFVYKPENNNDLSKLKKVLVSTDHHGKLQRHNAFNHLYHSEDMTYCNNQDVTCNGTFFAFSTLLNSEHVDVFNPSLRWRAYVPYFLYPGFPTEIYHPQIFYTFQGAYYDPSTSHFNLLIGCKEYYNKGDVIEKCMSDIMDGNYKMETCTVNLYSSESKCWKTVTLHMHEEDKLQPYGCTGVFSEGYYLWLNKSYKSPFYTYGVVGFSLKDELFKKIDLPKCPFHAGNVCTKGSIRVGEDKWIMKGCNENVVLFHSMGSSNAIALWKLLMQSESGWQWQRIELSCNPNQFSILTNLHRFPTDFYFETNKSGWWLWAEKSTSYNDGSQKNLEILEPQGRLRHSISMADLSSVLKDVPDDCYAVVDRIWHFESSNFWNILASS